MKSPDTKLAAALANAHKDLASATANHDEAATKLQTAKSSAFADSSPKGEAAYKAARDRFAFTSDMKAEAQRAVEEAQAAIDAANRAAKFARLEELKQRVTSESFAALVSDDVAAIVDLYRQIDQRAHVIFEKCDSVDTERYEARALMTVLGDDAFDSLIAQPRETARALARQAVRKLVDETLSSSDPARFFLALGA